MSEYFKSLTAKIYNLSGTFVSYGDSEVLLIEGDNMMSKNETKK